MILPFGSSLMVTTARSLKGVDSGNSRSRNCSLYIYIASARGLFQSTKNAYLHIGRRHLPVFIGVGLRKTLQIAAYGRD